jgi:fucose permease
MDFFRLAFLCMFHLLANDSFGMVFKHLRDFFNLEDLVSAFIQLHQLCSHVATSRSSGSWFEFFGLIGFWLWPSLLVAFVWL